MRAPAARQNLRLALIPLTVLLAARFALDLLYTLGIPIWEVDNEDDHFAYARYLAVHRSLLQPDDPEAQQIWENFQPRSTTPSSRRFCSPSTSARRFSNRNTIRIRPTATLA